MDFPEKTLDFMISKVKNKMLSIKSLMNYNQHMYNQLNFLIKRLFSIKLFDDINKKIDGLDIINV